MPNVIVNTSLGSDARNEAKSDSDKEKFRSEKKKRFSRWLPAIGPYRAII